jgi:hypothetical protein
VHILKLLVNATVAIEFTNRIAPIDTNSSPAATGISLAGMRWETFAHEEIFSPKEEFSSLS